MKFEADSPVPPAAPLTRSADLSIVDPSKTALTAQSSGVLSARNGAYLKKEQTKSGHLRRWIALAVIAGITASGAVYWMRQRPVEVAIILPLLTSVNETIASSGLVGGVKEAVIGASFNGAVVQLPIELGDHVRAGETLAVLKNNITQAQVTQAEMAVVTAQAQLKQSSRGPLASELRVAQMQVSQARALAAEALSDLDLAQKTQKRTLDLSHAGVVSKSELDNSSSALAAAQAKSRSGGASIQLAEAQLLTLKSTPRQEDVELARDRVSEARQSLLVVRQQAREATITAPFAGTITAVNIEVGQNVDALGLFTLVSDTLEIRVDLDESNLADLSVGQKALLSAAAFPGQIFEGRLKEISPSVNRIRGTISIKLEPIAMPAWLKPGQTLNVNLVTNQSAPRLLVPASALRRSGERTVVLVVQGRRALEKIVVTRPPTNQGVPVLAGLDSSDLVVLEPGKIQPGDIVRTRK